MTPEQLEALIEFFETQAIEAAYQVTDPECARPQETKAALRRVYEVFGVTPPRWRGLVMPNAELSGPQRPARKDEDGTE